MPSTGREVGREGEIVEEGVGRWRRDCRLQSTCKGVGREGETAGEGVGRGAGWRRD